MRRACYRSRTSATQGTLSNPRIQCSGGATPRYATSALLGAGVTKFAERRGADGASGTAGTTTPSELRPAEPLHATKDHPACSISLRRRDLTVPHGASTEERVRQRDGLHGLLALLRLPLWLCRASLLLQHGLLRGRGPLHPAVSPRLLWRLLSPGMRLA